MQSACPEFCALSGRERKISHVSKGYLLNLSCLPTPRDLSPAACSIPAHVWLWAANINLQAQTDLHKYVSTGEFSVQTVLV